MALRNPRQLALLKPKKRNKYGAKSIVVDDIRFDSRAECARYCQLKMDYQILENSLCVHEQWKFKNGKKYESDFQYWRREPGGLSWIVEDVKGRRTALYAFKKAQMKTEFGINIQEVEMDPKQVDVIIAAYLGSKKNEEKSKKTIG